jgi:hypothetical protein
MNTILTVLVFVGMIFTQENNFPLRIHEYIKGVDK